ncbi:MAG: hypothetical protein P4L26_04815, partial [Terracidiphilus sp.]|nr:hypothetical protein [Terracidiphilus sp.]
MLSGFRGFFACILIAVLSIPGDCLALPASQQSAATGSTTESSVLVATAVAPAASAADPGAPAQPQATPQQAAPPPQNGKAQTGMGGIAGGIGAAPVYDEQKRPITAGGFVDTGTVVFQDITKQAGLSGW